MHIFAWHETLPYSACPTKASAPPERACGLLRPSSLACIILETSLECPGPAKVFPYDCTAIDWKKRVSIQRSAGSSAGAVPRSNCWRLKVMVTASGASGSSRASLRAFRRTARPNGPCVTPSFWRYSKGWIWSSSGIGNALNWRHKFVELDSISLDKSMG